MPKKQTTNVGEIAEVIALTISEDAEVRSAAAEMQLALFRGATRTIKDIWGPLGSMQDKMNLLKLYVPAALRAMQTSQAAEGEQELRDTMARILEFTREG